MKMKFSPKEYAGLKSPPWYVWLVCGLAGWLAAMLLGGCYAVLQDPPADMKANLTPDSVASAPVQAPTTVQPPIDVSKARRVGWKPRHATPAGDVVEGHAIEITSTPLTQEVVAPSLVIPRAPRFVTPSGHGAASGAGRGRSSQETAPAPMPQPVPAPVIPAHPLLPGQGGVYVPGTP